MQLQSKVSIDITPTAPFAFDATFHKPSHFQSGDNDWQPGIRWQTFWFLKKNVGVVFRNAGSVDAPKIVTDIYSAKPLQKDFLEHFVSEIKYRYNLDLDLTDFYTRLAKDAFVGPVIRRFRGMRPGHQDSLYEYLIIGILLQNCTVRRSIRMMQSLFEKYGTPLTFDGRKLWCFWEPGALKNVSEEDLRLLKIGYRAKSIKKTDDHFGRKRINETDLRRKDIKTQTAELLKLYGVGPATVWYLLFDVFHQYDFFSHISPWEQKIYSKLFFNTDPEKPVPVKKLLNYFEKYGADRQLAVHYIWEDLWWKRKNASIPWLEKLIRV